MVNYPTITGSAFTREGFWVQTPGSQGKKTKKTGRLPGWTCQEFRPDVITWGVWIYFYINRFTYLFLLANGLFFCTHLWHADTLWPGNASMPWLHNPRLILWSLCHQRSFVMRTFIISLPINYLGWSVGMYVCIYGLLYHQSSFISKSLFIYKLNWGPPVTLGCGLARVCFPKEALATATALREREDS